MKNRHLLTAGISCAIISLLHIAIIVGGSGWYRFFGAGEGMAQLAEKGSIYPTIITITISSILILWSLYAFSGAGIIRRLPLLKQALAIISIIFLARGVLGIPTVIYMDDPYFNELESKMTFMFFSSLISLGLGNIVPGWFKAVNI